MQDRFEPLVPTLRSVSHIALTVPRLDQAIDFFVTYFGADLIYQIGQFEEADGDGMRRKLDVDPRAKLTIAMLRLGQHTNFERFEYEALEQISSPPRNSDISGHHLAFREDDIDASYEYVSSISGVTVSEGPNGVDPDSPVASQRWFYFKTPWGMQLEMTTCPTGDDYVGLPGERTAPPTATWR